MKSNDLRFLCCLIILPLLLTLSVMAGEKAGWMNSPSFLWQILAFLVLSTLFLYYRLKEKATPILFTQKYLVSIAIKLIAGSVFILLIIYGDSRNAYANAAFFISSYILFTALEVYFLYKSVNEKPDS